jgi:hypothetical protein
MGGYDLWATSRNRLGTVRYYYFLRSLPMS